jgi:prefoldin subunit 5
MKDQINLNNAERDELTRLPGVGLAMADRIMAARPFETVDDLLGVSGVGPALFDRLQPLVTLANADTQEDVIYLGTEVGEGTATDADQATIEGPGEGPVEDSVEVPDEVKTQFEGEPVALAPEEGTFDDAEAEQDEGPEVAESIPREKAIVPVKNEESDKEPASKPTKHVTWGQTFLVAGACSFVAFILAVLLSLGILGSINSGLSYASSAQFQSLNRQLNNLGSQIEILLEDTDSLRTRLDNLESMTGKIDGLDADVQQLIAEMATTGEVIDEMNATILDIVDSNDRFQTFLQGLGELMDTLISEPKEAP